jgi:mRNA interferase MazF
MTGVTVRRGDIWLADLNPTRGSEQAGMRPVLVFQNDMINPFTRTILAIPFTTNLMRARLPSCVRVPEGEGGLSSESVALCHQMRVLDKTRLERRLGSLTPQTMSDVERVTLFTLGVI